MGHCVSHPFWGAAESAAMRRAAETNAPVQFFLERHGRAPEWAGLVYPHAEGGATVAFNQALRDQFYGRAS
jgi:hypothetical protein